MVTLASCATCRFWTPTPAGRTLWDQEKEEDIELPHHRCLRILHEQPSVADGEGDAPAKPETPAFLNDGSGYTASLNTLPTFGCTLHEAR
jgi:hypothetical protein